MSDGIQKKKVISMATATEEELRRAILNSEAFRQCLSQKHHLETTAGKHSLAVERSALRISRFLRRFGIETDQKRLVVAALCHDLGMANRKMRYKSTFQCHRLHPGASVEEARKIICDLDTATERAIRFHMWPLALHLPASKEGWILSIADKQASLTGTFSYLLKKPAAAFHRRFSRKNRF